MRDRIRRTLVACAAVSALAAAVSAVAAAGDPATSAAIDARDYVAAAGLLRAELAANPGDEPTRFTLARVLGWAGDYPSALAEYDTLIARSPDNVDYSLGRAQVLAWQGRDAAALDELVRARKLAPDYEAVLQLELEVSDRVNGVRRSAPLRTLVTAGTVRESYTTDLPDWSTLFVEVRHPLDSRRSLHGAVASDERFGAHDTTLRGGADWRLSGPWSVGFELGAAPDAEFLPEAAATIAALRTLPRGWETELRLQHRSYSTDDVTGSGAGVARYFGNFRVGYGFDLARLNGADTSTLHTAKLGFYPSGRLQFNASVYSGEEAEAILPGVVVTTDVEGMSAGARHALGDRLGLAWWLGSHHQGDLYWRRHVGISLTFGL